ncbi:uroporphyrinogen-III C-methyltransferase [Gracilibacillus oryzae]|uniref:Uroporphyrinogen-III C-methyltransferase n=1 Tax=Gracilibacillus oryzae TaxID=1672701 RepID=A0A7C8GVS6_9BACI|nr:uroporphyrinogen-III C-methyltransferase [Gracilibacillus oryzae]KAB8139408.1 uroporphyrinogen-III C-methyltransferase [Gracilibacillus oryzae]
MSKVYIVGAGPGDKELITLKGLRAIKEADVILYDRLINNELLDYAKEDCELIFCGKKPRLHGLIQEEIHRLLVQYAKQGKVVTRLKGGDPFIFGRGGEEGQVLKAENIPFEIVPGITSGISAAAYAGIPLTHRGVSGSVSFINASNPDNRSEEEWEHIVKGVDTLCFYMGVKHFPRTVQYLINAGLKPDTPVAMIHWGTFAHQKTIVGTLADIEGKMSEISNPSMIVIGEVVNLHKELQWFEQIAAEQLN